MSRASERLREFHEAFEVPLGDPSRPELAGRRCTLHDEEASELIAALCDYALTLAAEERERSARPVEWKLEAVARELADVMVVAYGTADLLGIDLDAAFDAVMDANMAKLPACRACGGIGVRNIGNDCEACDGSGHGAPIKREDGKVLRPEGWTPPDMSGAIR